MGCLFIKVVCELGLERCEIVWFIFGVGVRVLRGFFLVWEDWEGCIFGVLVMVFMANVG